MENELLASLDKVVSYKVSAVGNDLVFIPDFASSFNELFKKKVYTEREKAYCEQFEQSLLRYASTWAAKEAVYKALKQVNEAIVVGWKNIEILRDRPAGKPKVKLHKMTEPFQIIITLSHDGDYAWAIAVVQTVLQ